MKQVMLSRWVPIVFLLISTACSGETQSPTIAPTTAPVENSPIPESTATVISGTETPVASSTPSAANTEVSSSPTEAVSLFTDADGTYRVNLTPADFVEVVDNPYFPLPIGAKWVYEIRQGNKPPQTDTLEVQKEKRQVNGIQATVVRDTVSSGNQIVEDTYDWFVQDKYGNVWYVGEEVDNYVAGVLVNHSGSWEWGVDGAQPGIIMWADPAAHLNEKYRQEYYAGKAEDMGEVLSADESLTVPLDSFDRVVKTLDFSNIEAGQEQKFYAPGIGLLKEMDVNGNEEVVLMDFTQPPQ
jgi:hypothetical protein